MPPTSLTSSTPVLVFGGGGHGKQVIDLLRREGHWEPAVVFDDSRLSGDTVAGVEVIGGDDGLDAVHDRGITAAINAVGGIVDIEARVAVFDRLVAAGFDLPTIVDPTAVVEPTAELGAGCQVFAHAYVGSAARLGRGVLVNTSAVVSHDCVLGDSTNLSPGALLAGEVTTGARVRIGMGATVNVGVLVGAAARVGNGATVKADVPASGRVHAGHVWPAG